jgi:hypothetical protein
VLEAGDRIPEAAVWTPERERVPLRALVDDGPILLLFYLFDFSAT